MKSSLLLLLLLMFSISNVWSQEKGNQRIPLIGENAPSFTAETTKGTLEFPKDFGNKWKIIFSHPRDFTPVCSSEVLELAHLQSDFDALGVKMVVVSTDDLQQHKNWKKALEDISYKERKPVKIDFPFVDDKSTLVSRQYGMIHDQSSSTKDVRGVFIISPQDKIEAIFFYPMNIGRNMDEIKRTVQALQATGKGKDRLLTPANWQAGDDMMVPQFPYTEKQLKENPAIKDAYYELGGFMWFKKANPPLSGL